MAILLKKMKIIANFLTFKWQFSGGSGCRLVEKEVSGCFDSIDIAVIECTFDF